MQSEHSSPMSVSLETASVVSYAMAHNGISVISRVTVDGVVRDLPGAVVRFDIGDANGALSATHSRTVDLAAGRVTVLTDLRLVLDPAVMVLVEEQRPGAIRVWVEVGGVRLAEASVRVRVLAAQQPLHLLGGRQGAEHRTADLTKRCLEGKGLDRGLVHEQGHAITGKHHDRPPANLSRKLQLRLLRAAS